MAFTITGEWKISQTNVNGAKYTGVLILKQQRWQITGKADWDKHPDGSVVGAVVGRTVSFSVIYPGGLVGHYAAELNPVDQSMTQGVCLSSTGDFGTWEAKYRGS